MNTASGYRHTQRGTLILALVLGVSVPMLVAIFLTTSGPEATVVRVILAVTFAVVLLSALTFGSLTISVQDGNLAWHFGSGLIRKSVPIEDILHAETTRTSPLWGWGIHWTPMGWLYNVSGLDAVAVRLRNGRQFVLGTDEPHELLQAVTVARAARGTARTTPGT